MQFDVYRNLSATSKKRFPFLLDVQSELLEDLDTRVVVPLAAKELFAAKTLTQLMPVLEVNGKEHVAVTPQLAGIARRELGGCIGNLATAREQIIAALDLMFTGV